MTKTEFDPEELVQKAIEARGNAYAPYSHYPVGAALLTASGEIYTGCNVENAAFTPTICAERTAVVKAVSEGKRDFVAIAVATENGGAPCGVCRQVLREFGEDIEVLITDAEGDYRTTTVGELLPDSFSALDLNGGKSSKRET